MKPWIVAFALTACKGPADTDPPEADADTDTDADTDSDTDADTDSDTDADTDADTDVLVSGEGSVTLVQLVASTATGPEFLYLAGVFVDDRQGIPNLAECFPDAFNACVDQSPALDGYVDLDAVFDPGPATLYDVGGSLGLGAFSASRTNTPFGPTYEGVPQLDFPTDPLGLAFGPGAFGTYAGTADLEPPPSLIVFQPIPTDPSPTLIDGQTFGFTWIPDPSGLSELTLYVVAGGASGGTTLSRLYQLDDDGSFELEIDSLGLTNANDEVVFVLARSRYADVDVNGNPVHVGVRSEVRYLAFHPPLAGRDPLSLDETCDAGASELEAGSYWLQFSGTNETTPTGAGCTGSAANGPDRVGRIVLDIGERVTLDAEILGEDSSLYLVTDCADVGTCVAGSDYRDFGGETVVFTNTTGAPLELFVVLDTPSFLFTSAVALLDVSFDVPPIPEEVPDFCALAEQSQLQPTGTITVDLTLAVDDLDPGAQGCSGVSSPGPDRMFPVAVGPDEVLDVRASAPVSLYLLQDCDDETTCEDGAGPYGRLTWYNTSGAEVIGYVVVDDLGDPGFQGPFELTIDRHVVLQLEPATDCAAASAVAPLETGTHLFEGDLTGYANLLDLAVPGPSCTGFPSAAGEGLVPVRIGPGETIEVTYTQEGSPGDGSLYLLSDCTDTQTAVACDDAFPGGEFISWTNAGPAPVDLTLVLDSWGGQGGTPVAGPFSLAVVIGP